MSVTANRRSALDGRDAAMGLRTDVIHQMLRVVTFAQTVGALGPDEEVGWDASTFRDALRGLSRLGINDVLARVPSDSFPDNVADVATAALAAIEESPIPEAEWEPMAEVLRDLLPGLVGVSVSSASRYQSGQRPTPDPVAGRLHVLTQIVADLSGSYNDFGIRRWFGRGRQALGGRAPGEILSGSWDPDGPDVARVRELARRLLGAAVA